MRLLSELLLLKINQNLTNQIQEFNIAVVDSIWLPYLSMQLIGIYKRSVLFLVKPPAIVIWIWRFYLDLDGLDGWSWTCSFPKYVFSMPLICSITQTHRKVHRKAPDQPSDQTWNLLAWSDSVDHYTTVPIYSLLKMKNLCKHFMLGD